MDKIGGLIKEFKPLNHIIKVNTPNYHSADDAYVSYFKFKLISEGDDAMYIHSINFDEDGTDQLLDFDNTIAANNLYGTQIYGYKPGYDASNASATSNDPQMSIKVEDVMADYAGEGTFLNTVGGSPATLETGNMMKSYRDYGSGAFYVMPKSLLHLGSSISEADANAADPGQTDSSVSVEEIEPYGYNLNADYIFEQDSSATNVPYGNPSITVKMKVPAKGTLIDFGDYFTTMKITYYKNERSNRHATSGSADNEISQANIRLHEMKVIVKMTVAPAPILSITDNENEEYFNNSTINMGNLNLG